MIKAGREPDLTKKEERVFALRGAVENVAGIASRVTRAIRLIQDDPKLSSAEKRSRIDTLQDQRNRFFLQFSREIPSDIQRERGFAIPFGKP